MTNAIHKSNGRNFIISKLREGVYRRMKKRQLNGRVVNSNLRQHEYFHTTMPKTTNGKIQKKQLNSATSKTQYVVNIANNTRFNNTTPKGSVRESTIKKALGEANHRRTGGYYEVPTTNGSVFVPKYVQNHYDGSYRNAIGFFFGGRSTTEELVKKRGNVWASKPKAVTIRNKGKYKPLSNYYLG